MYSHLEPTIEPEVLSKTYISEELLQSHLRTRNIPDHLVSQISSNPLEIDLNEAELYLDPLDSTKDFTTGNH